MILPVTNILQTNSIANLNNSISDQQNSDFGKIIEKKLENVSNNDTKQDNSKEYEKTSVKDESNLERDVNIKNKSEVENENVNSLKENNEMSEEKEYKNITDIEKVKLLKEEVMKKLADILEISDEELLQLLNDNNMVFLNLFNNENIINLLKDYLDLSTDVDLISNDSFLEKYKEIKLLIDETVEKSNISYESLAELQKNITEILPDEQIKELIDSEIISETDFVQNDTSGIEGKIEIVDTRDNSSNNNSNNANKQDDFQQIMSNIITEKTIHINSNGVEEIVYKNINTTDVFKQVINQMKILLTPESTSMLVKLQPESLGNVAFSVTSEQGIITGNFVVESQAVKEMIDGNLANLKTVLVDQGIEVEEINVVVGNTNQFLQQENSDKNLEQFLKSKNKKISKVSLESLEEDEEENIINSSLNSLDNNHSIEFTA